MSERPRRRRNVWIRDSEGRERREGLATALRGWWKVWHPFKAWRLYRTLRRVSDGRRRAANERLLEARLADPSLSGLNEEQRRAVIVQEDRTLVVAGAGTGKTHTMVAKARDTVRTGIARASDIAFVTFTRKAAQEIRERSADLEDMEIGTLHHLARLVIARAEGAKPKLTPLAEDDGARLERFEAWLLEAIQADPSLLTDLETRAQAVARCRAPGDEAPPEEVRVPPDGVLVRSMGEARIATTLHLAKIDYRYETEFPVPEEHQTRRGARYHPDFYIPDDSEAPSTVHGGIWLEHFAHDADGDLPQRWEDERPGAIRKYQRDREWKEKLHAALGTRFTSTEYGDIQRCFRDGASFPDLLLQRIAAQGKGGFEPPTKWDVESAVRHMKAREGSGAHLRVTYEIDAWIRSARQQVNSDDALRATFSARETAEEAAALYRLARPVLSCYERHLAETRCVDHEGTILKAWGYLRDDVVAPPWRVILVDEYQDVNPAQAAFVHALLKPRDPSRPSTAARLTAVGDDWQAIFGFQGGDVDLIRRFHDPAHANEGATERIALKRTYRFGQPLADSTRRFVIRGKGAIDREVVGSPDVQPHPRWPSSIVVASSRLTAQGERRLKRPRPGLTNAVLAVLLRIAEQSQGAEVLVAGRRRVDLESAADRRSEGTGIERRTIDNGAKQLGMRVTYSTVHKAKGTEADYVIFLDTGPPRAGEAAGARALERALTPFRGSDTAREEERRIWYVALTRARRKVYLIVSAGVQSHSAFADELYHNEGARYDVGEDELAELLEPMRPSVPCPACARRGRAEAVLSVREGRDGRFAGCTTFSAGPDHHCGHTERICERCGEGLMIRLGNGRARCQNARCAHHAPLCRCPVSRPMVVRRHGKTGERFWGCQRFGLQDSCSATKPLPRAERSARR